MVKTKKQIAKELTAWMNYYYNWSSTHPESVSYPEFIELKMIIKELRK
jgi:hypothetical protein